MFTLYGLKNCDTCRKAVKWLEAEGIAHRFHDLKAEGISGAEVKRLAAAVGWEALLNKSSTTWRGLADSEKAGLTEAKAVKLMATHPALIKRPVFDNGKAVISGFREAQLPAIRKAFAK
ncbi:MAG: arsenate reductase [Parvibaculum sp.]|nr:arsenate reductase [Parvibaculum sp.]